MKKLNTKMSTDLNVNYAPKKRFERNEGKIINEGLMGKKVSLDFEPEQIYANNITLV